MDQTSTATSTSGSAHRAELTLFPVAHQPCSAPPASQRQRQRQPVVSPPVSKQAPSPLWPVLAAAHTHTPHPHLTTRAPGTPSSSLSPILRPPTSNALQVRRYLICNSNSHRYLIPYPPQFTARPSSVTIHRLNSLQLSLSRRSLCPNFREHRRPFRDIPLGFPHTLADHKESRTQLREHNGTGYLQSPTSSIHPMRNIPIQAFSAAFTDRIERTGPKPSCVIPSFPSTPQKHT